jgi:hypothetical protein
MASLLEQMVDAVATEMGASAFTTFGPIAKSQRTSAPRLAWIHQRDEHKAPWQHEGQTARTAKICESVFAVEVWGQGASDGSTTDHEVAWGLKNDLVVALDDLYGENGSAVGNATPVDGEADNRAGIRFVLEVRLRTALEAERYTTGNLVSTTLHLYATDPLGQSPEEA